MSTVRRFVQNTAILMLAKLIQPLITFYLIIAISREIGVQGFGVYATILKYVMIFQIISGFGLRNLLAREIAQNKQESQRYIIAGSYIAVGFSIFSALIMCLTVNILSNNLLVIQGTYVAGISLFASGLADVYEGAITGHEKLVHVGYALFVENIFKVLCSLWLIYSGYGIVAIIWTFVIGRFLSGFYFFVFIRRYIAVPMGKIEVKFLKQVMHQAKTFALIMICVTIYWNVDAIMLESLTSAKNAGYYSAAYRFLSLSMVLVQSYVSSLFPVIATYFKISMSNFEFACKKSLRILVLITVPISIAVSLNAEKIILLLFKDEFLPSVKVLQYLIWGLIPYSITQIFAYALIASHKQNVDLTVNASSMLLNIALNFLLIPKFGIMGATMATLVSIIFYVCLQMPFVVNKLIKLEFTELLIIGIKIAALGLIMAIVINILIKTNLFIVLLFSSLIYIIGALRLGLIEKDERRLVCNLIKVYSGGAN